MSYCKLVKRDWLLLFYGVFVKLSVQNGGGTVMSWAQLLLWSVLLSFASWASILFEFTLLFVSLLNMETIPEIDHVTQAEPMR